MKTNFKEKLVDWSQDDCFKLFLRLEAIIWIVMFFFAEIVEEKIGVYIMAVAVIVYVNFLDAIQQQKKEVVKNNRMINIILSNYNFVFWVIWFSISFPLLVILNEIQYIIYYFLLKCFVIIVTVSINCKFAMIISDHFKKKLIIPKEEE